MSATVPRDETTGLVIALPAEARSMGLRTTRVGDCARWERGWIAVSGIGGDNAARATERLLDRGVTALANWGVAGALDACLAPGDVLIPDRILCGPDQPVFQADPATAAHLAAALSSALTVRRGTLWTARQPVATRVEKRALADRFGAAAVDMEAASIAAIAARERLPFVAVKVICDPATRELPGRIVQALGDGGVSLRMLAAIAFGGPSGWRAIRALSRDFTQARRVLAAAAQLLPPGAQAT